MPWGWPWGWSWGWPWGWPWGLLVWILLGSHPAFSRGSAPFIVVGTAVSPAANATCFSPTEPCDEMVRRFIVATNRSLDVAAFDLTLDDFARTLLALARRVPVRLVVDQRQSRGPHSLVQALAERGLSIRFGHQRGLMHNKYIIRDGQMVETGSFNFTNHAARANHENQVYLGTAAIVERYQRAFSALWSEADPLR